MKRALNAWNELKSKITLWNSSELLVKESLEFYPHIFDWRGEFGEAEKNPDGRVVSIKGVAIETIRQKVANANRLLKELAR